MPAPLALPAYAPRRRLAAASIPLIVARGLLPLQAEMASLATTIAEDGA